MLSGAEQKLVSQCLAGDRPAQQRLYRQYADAMYNICHRMMGQAAEAEDVLQDAFVEIFRKLDTFRGEATLGAWMKRIVINHCLNGLKKRRIQFSELQAYHDELPDDPAGDAEDVQYEVARIREAIRQLPDGYRQVLTLYLLEGYDHSEIAHILGIQESGSKSQYSRAKARLRALLVNQPAGQPHRNE